MAKKKPVLPYSFKHAGGRPPMYKTAEELQERIDDYFLNGFRTRPVVSKSGDVTEVPILTITGLILHCGFSDRASFYDLEKREEFTHTVKRARAFIVDHYEGILQSNNVTGAIFALKNFGWKDTQHVESENKNVNVNTEAENAQEAQRAYSELIKSGEE